MIIDEVFPEPYKFVFCLLRPEIFKEKLSSNEYKALHSLISED